jgi:hypothetical protein
MEVKARVMPHVLWYPLYRRLGGEPSADEVVLEKRKDSCPFWDLSPGLSSP